LLVGWLGLDSNSSDALLVSLAREGHRIAAVVLNRAAGDFGLFPTPRAIFLRRDKRLISQRLIVGLKSSRHLRMTASTISGRRKNK
jgi:hypothetical protein